MRFEWDERKRKANVAKHGIDFADARIVFAGATFTFEDDRYTYEEQRFVTLGMLRGVSVAMAHTESDDTIRVISMRKATKNEQERYYRGFSD